MAQARRQNLGEQVSRRTSNRWRCGPSAPEQAQWAIGSGALRLDCLRDVQTQLVDVDPHDGGGGRITGNDSLVGRASEKWRFAPS